MLVDIEKKIYVIRNQRVMMDADLAQLYGIETRSLNQAVRRNIERFPEDFMFNLTDTEVQFLRSQIVILEMPNHFRYKPFVFTENGVAMLSSILKSPQAVQVNISIIRIFTRLRSFLMLEDQLHSKLTNLEEGTNKMFKVVFERLDDIQDDARIIKPVRKIGLNNKLTVEHKKQ